MRIVFIGSGDIGLPSLQALFEAEEHIVAGVVTQPDKPVGRHQEVVASAIKKLALEQGVPVFQPRKIRAEGALEEMRGLAPEVVVVMAYGQILPGALLRWPTVACLNLHASLLPRHRGAAPVHAAIEAGDAESGITVMHMDEGLDTGPMLLMRRLAIGPRETAGSLHDRLGELAPGALAEALALLKEGRAPSIPQEEAQATYAAKLTREHGEIDWTAAPLLIDRKIRAMNPWPCAQTWVPAGGERKKLKVFMGDPQESGAGQPGTVLKADREGILVAAGEGAVLLREVQLEGKRRMSAGDFLQGFALAPGTILGRS
jgi:methionyl-tRNA formyltransferase